MKSTVIEGALLIDPSQNLEEKKDLWIEEGKIKAIDQPGSFKNLSDVEKVQASDLWLMPGFIDIHVHFREPGQEYKETIESGSNSAVAGGFTAVSCMANTNPVNDNPYVTRFILDQAKEKSACKLWVTGAVTKGLHGEELADIGLMVEAGISAISDDGMSVMNSYLMRKAMDYARAFDIPVISHAEDTHLVRKGVMNEGALSSELGLTGNPAAAEEIMVAREIALSRLTGCPVHIAHLSTDVALRHVMRAKEDGLPVTAEVTPHHLLFDEKYLKTYNTYFKMAPPLRTERDVEALRKGLKDGVIDMIATDHAPHSEHEKDVEFDHAAFGVIGLETAVSSTYALVEKGCYSRKRWIESFTTAPSRFMKKDAGTLRVGMDADLILFDSRRSWTVTKEATVSKSKNSPFLGQSMKGKVLQTWVRGKKVYESV